MDVAEGQAPPSYAEAVAQPLIQPAPAHAPPQQATPAVAAAARVGPTAHIPMIGATPASQTAAVEPVEGVGAAPVSTSSKLKALAGTAFLIGSTVAKSAVKKGMEQAAKVHANIISSEQYAKLQLQWDKVKEKFPVSVR